MAAATAPEKKKPGPAPLVPPDERFWKRYSPHGEMPLSISGSVGLHVLFFGGLLLVSIYFASLFFKPDRSLPVEPVRLDVRGGGGGKTTGVGDGKGVGVGPEDITQGDRDKDLVQDGLDDAPRAPALNPVEKAVVQQQFDDPSARYLKESQTDQVKRFARMEESLRRKLADGLHQPGKGKGGSGSGGGSGTGTGTGDGSGTGAGKASLTNREKRMLRWHMIFTANSGAEYLGQLRGLGAILAFPIPGGKATFLLVRDLRPGGKAKEEDVSQLNRIYWIDDKDRSVRDIMGALSLRLAPVPNRFIAFMPKALEDDLYVMEKRYVENVLRARFDEDKIDETRFKVVLTARGYRPELINVSMRP